MSYILRPDDYLSNSRQLYCFITDEAGSVQCVNQLAETSLHISHGTTIPLDSALTDNNLHTQIISHSLRDHKKVKISWEVFPVATFDKLYKWIAPVKNILLKEAAKQSAVAEKDTTIEFSETKEHLQKSEKFYRNLIADSLDGMILSDASGKINFVSPTTKSILGYELEEVVGKNLFDFVHPADYELATQSFQKEVISSPEVKYIVIRLLKKSGDWLWCMVRGHNMLQNPYVESIVVYFHDDTLRKQTNDALKESEQRFRKLIRDLQIGVLLQDTTGKIIMLNNAILKILNVDEHDLYGKHIWDVLDDVVHEDGSSFLTTDRPLYKAAKTKKSVHAVVMGIYRPSLGDRVWLMVNADPMLDQDGNILHVVCSIADITERKKLEQKLLYDKINHQKLLTQATIDGQEKERKEIGKELHDNIGQQLTTTKLFLDLAKTTADDNTNEMISLALKGISDVINEVRRMSRSLVPPTLGDLGLVDSLNDLIDSISRTQYLKIEFDYFDFNEDFISDNKKLMFFRIIQEQLNNIVKHANAKSVHITLSDEESYLLLEVKDDGEGFDIKNTRKGLGLTNMKNRAELFGGKIDIISAPQQGCTLRICIPSLYEETL